MDSINQLLEKTKFATPDQFVFLSDDSCAPPTEDENSENAALQTAIKVKNVGNVRFQEKKFDDAIFAYTKAIAKLQGMDDRNCTRELAICYQNRAAAYEKEKRFDKSVADATKAIELNELYAKAHFRRAKAYIGEKKFYSALQDIVQAAILTKFRNESYNKIVANLNSRFVSDTSTDHARNAFKEMDCKKPDCAHCRSERLRMLTKSGILVSITIKFASDLPNKGYIRAMKGLIDMNDREIMIGCNEEMANRGEYFDQSCILRAYMNVVVYPSSSEIDRYRDLEQLNSIISRNESSMEVKFGAKLCRANIFIHGGRLSEANRFLDEVEADYPNNGLVYIIKCGALTMKSVGYPQLYDNLCRCCALLPNFFEVHFQKALAEFNLEQNDINLADKRLVTQLKELILKFPKELTPRLVLGSKYLDENQIGKAKELIKKADRDFPDKTNIDCLRGRLNPMHPASVEYLKHAIRVNTEDDAAHQCLFNYYVLKSHEYAKALEVANRAMTNCLEDDINAEMFRSRQTLLSKIVAQNFWDKL